MTINDADAYVICNGTKYTAKNGKVSFKVPNALASDAVSFQIGNNGSSAKSFTIKFANLKGSYANPEKISKLTGDFEQSDFVFKTTGVSNVCERSAVMLADKDYNNLVVKKVASNAVTVAISRKKRGISFE